MVASKMVGASMQSAKVLNDTLIKAISEAPPVIWPGLKSWVKAVGDVKAISKESRPLPGVEPEQKDWVKDERDAEYSVPSDNPT